MTNNPSDGLYHLIRDLADSTAFLTTVSVANAVAVAAVLFNAFFVIRKSRDIIVPFNIAVIGIPRSGKTTLITTMFQTIFYSRFLARKIVVRGKETIERVNKDIETIKLGRSLGPTAEQDIFAYRADIAGRSGIFRKTYRVAIGDFAGEYTDMLSADVRPHALHESSFFKWVMEADAYIFVLDIAAFMKEGDAYVTRISGELRSAWQLLVEYHVEGKKKIRSKRLAIAVNKADLLYRDIVGLTDKEDRNSLNEVWRLGFDHTTPSVVELPPEVQRLLNDDATRCFQTVIEYFRLQSDSSRTFVVSSFGLMRGQPLGVESLLEFILPG